MIVAGTGKEVAVDASRAGRHRIEDCLGSDEQLAVIHQRLSAYPLD